MSATKILNPNIAKTSREKLVKNGTKSPGIRSSSSLQENENITIRLSDLGIIQRSPTELELQIQSGRVLYILDKTIEKLQMAVCLSRLLRHNACMLRRFIPQQEVEFIQTISWKYMDHLPATASHLRKCSLTVALSSAIEKIAMNESKKIYSGRDHERFVDPHMAQVMEILWGNRNLREKILNEFELIPENPATILVNCIRSLREAAQYRLGTSAVEERARERRLRKAWKANSLIEEKIEKAQQQLEKQREDLGQQLELKNAVVLDYMDRIEALRLKFKDDVRRKIQDSEREMAEDTVASELRQVDLSNDAKGVTQQFESLLSQHLAYEKGLRAKRLKVETQLASWLAKYDADIGERQVEFEEITRGFEEERAEMDALQEKFDEQEKEYLVLMGEKEEEEQRMWEEKAYQFLLNRSARIIQRCWRAYRRRKIERRKAKRAKAKAKKEKSVDGAEGGAPKPPSAGKGKKGGGKDKKGKGKDKEKGATEAGPAEGFRGPDFQAALESKFGGAVTEDLKGEEFGKKEVVVDLSADPAGVTDVKVE